ncbi:MAG: cytidylate kinase-like family protein [Opitutaceae bacterium]|nr:cytidylate kinase-like family protein [Opitutaceae bacterium]
MTQHHYLEYGLTILETRLKGPQPSRRSDHGVEARPFITISRETGAGATTLGQLLLPLLDARLGAEDQRWVLLDKNLLTHALTVHHLPERLAEFLPEDRIPELRAVIGELIGLHPPLWQIEQKVTETIRQLAGIGRVIFVGRAAQLITQALPGGFHLRLVAARESRISRMMALLNCDARSAEMHIQKNDHARRRFLKTYFDQEINDPHLYDLVINTDRVAPASAAQLVVQALGDKLAKLPMGASAAPWPSWKQTA